MSKIMSRLIKQTVSCIFILLTLSLFLTTCDDPNFTNNPFEPNMGPKVVVEPPTIYDISPVSGSYLSGIVNFTAKAKAYIKVEKVEVYIFEDEENGQIEVPWTIKGIELSGDVKLKTMRYEFDTSKYNSGKDGPIRMKFRVFDSAKKAVESIELIYIIKNYPSTIKMASPPSVDIENPAKVSDIPWGSDIRGTVIDRRGLRPGYPQIKLWPANLALPAGKDEPEDDDPQWGYVSLFLTNYDDMEKDGNGKDAGHGKYADRKAMRVVNATSFGLRLAEYDIVDAATGLPVDANTKMEDRRVSYRVDNGKHKLFAPGTVYNFKIMTMDTSSDPLNKYYPTDEGPFITGYFPPMGFGTPNENSFEYRTGQPARIHVYNADSRPTVEINNDDITYFNGESINIPDANKVLSDIKNRPNIYITEPSSKKIEILPTAGNSNPVLFRLRLKAGFTEGGKIYGATLSWLHEATGRSGTLAWDDPVVFGPDGIEEAIFKFTANAGMKDSNNKQIFTTSVDPYILIFTVKVVNSDDPAIIDPEYRYVVYMDGENPNVSIRSVRGAVSEPAGTVEPAPGGGKDYGLIRKDYYTVNGNIQVSVERTDDSGIMSHKKDANMGEEPPEAGYSMVKWFIETVETSSPNSPSTTGATVLADLIKYKENPSAENLNFFYSIAERHSLYDNGDGYVASGWVRRPIPGAALAADRAQHFKLNTTYIQDWQWKPDPSDPNDPNKGGPFLWLYIIAMDQVQNLGFIVQKIKVDESTDKPVMNVNPLSQKNAAGTAITDENGLNVNMDGIGQNATRLMSGNWDAGKRNNILARNQGINLNFTDDDGIALSDIKIKLTVVAPLSDLKGRPATVTITAADVLKAGGKRDRSGVLTQKIMAEYLYGAASDESLLRDGIYKIEFEVTDDKNEKVDIPASYRTPGSSLTGDTPPVTATASAVYYFAVSTEMPRVTVKYPDDNAWGSEGPIPIEGEVKSRLDIKSLWITFTPDVIGLTNNPLPRAVDLITPAAGTAEPDAEGYYNYTWKFAPDNTSTGKGPGVIFNPATSNPAFDTLTRDFTLEAYDRIGNMGTAKRTVQIDDGGPDVTISDYNHGRPPEVVGSVTATYLYGKVSFTASASDPNGLYEVDGKSGIKWWVVEKDATLTWNTDPVVYQRSALPASPPPPVLPTGAPAAWTGGGNFLLSQSNGGRYTWVIDTRYLQDGKTYWLYVISLDKAGNPGYAYEEFIVDWKRDYPTIDETSLDPLPNTVKAKDATISGTVSDIDLFKPANKNTYVSIRFPKAATGKPTATDGSDWDEWIPIKISDTYSASKGGIDPSGAIVYKFKASEYTSTPVGNTSTVAARAFTYLSNDGIKYYQIKVTDEPVGPTDAEKTAGAKWYGKNPDLFMQNNTAYPGYQYVNHGSVSKVFPEDTTAPITNPNMNPAGSYSFIVDDTFPEIFFKTWDPTPGHPGNPGYPPNDPKDEGKRPTFSKVELLIAALNGYVQEYKLSDLSIEYSGKVKVNNVSETKTFRKLIINNRATPPTFATDPDDGKYLWNLNEGITKLDISPDGTSGADILFKQIFDAAEQGMQIITFEATDMVPKTRRVSYVFAKDTQGPEINFNISRAIKRDNVAPGFSPAFPASTPSWPSDWRYGGTAWTGWTQGWKDIIENWPSEYAFKTTAAVIAALKAEHSREPSTVIGDPEDNYGKPGYNAPAIAGTFNDLYSSVRILVPANADTWFYYRFKDKLGALITPPLEKLAPAQTQVSGSWMRKKIEASPVDAQGKPTQNEKEASWKIELNKADGFVKQDGSALPDGENWVDIWVADSAGNISDIYNVRFYLERTAPILGEDPNPDDPDSTTDPKEKLTDAGEFIIDEIAKLGNDWKNKTPADKRLPEIKRVFSAAGDSNTNMAFTLQGTVSDFNFSGMTITIGQEGYGTYTVTASVAVGRDLSGNWTYTYPDDIKNDSPETGIKRLSLTVPPVYLPDGTPKWTWTLSVLQEDVAGLRDAANGAADSARRYIRVTASDKAKKVGPVDWFFYLDTKKPKLEYTNLNTGELAKATSFENNSLALSGLVEDDTRIKDVQFMIGRWSYAAPKEWQWWDKATSTWKPTLPDKTTWPSAFTSATVPTRQTSMNWSINQAVLNAANTKAANTFPANLFDNEGYYRLDLYVTDFSLGDGNPHSTTYVNDPNFEDKGVYTEAVEGQTIGASNTYNPTTGTGFRSSRVFYIDKKDPTLKWGWFNPDGTADPDDTYNTSNKTYFRNELGQAKFSFTVGDGNTIQYWKVEVVNNEAVPPTNALNKGISNQTEKNWVVASNDAAAPALNTRPIPIPANASNVPLSGTDIVDQKLILAPFMTKDGLVDDAVGTNALDMALGKLPTYTVTITVKDGAGRTASISKQFTLDNTPPVFVQDKFSPASYKYGNATTPPVVTGDPKREYTYDAVTGKFNIRGNTTDNSNQIKAISYYVVNSAAINTPIAAGDFPTPKWITDNKKWRYSGGTGDNSPIIQSGSTTLIEIDQGTFAWRIMVPNTSDFFTDGTAARYMQKTKTGTNPSGEVLKDINGTPTPITGANVPPNPGTYFDVDSISETALTPASPVSRTVPYLTFQDLNNQDFSNPKVIYGNEDVGVITVYVRAEDLAGNVAYDVLKYWIWPEGDRPIVTQINNPNSNKDAAETDRYMNGTIRLSGMAKDNERVKYVWFRVLGPDGTTPYTNLQIPRWNEETWEAVTTGTLYQTPVSDASAANSYKGYLGSRRTDDPSTSQSSIGDGWYMANGGNSREVSWWAYINTNGELDPDDDTPKKFTVQVRAQDVKYDDKADKWVDYSNDISGYRGLTSKALTVDAWVVANAPTFENQRIAPLASDAVTNWDEKDASGTFIYSLDAISIRNRSSYKVTVKNKLGISAIRWSPTLWDKTLNSNNGAFQANPNIDTFNLLASFTQTNPSYTYVPGTSSVYLNSTGTGLIVGTKAEADAALTGKTTAMALRVVPKTLVSGSSTIYQEYDVFVDMNADQLLAKMVADDPNYGINDPDHDNYNATATGRAGQVVGSVRYPVYMSAAEVSKATPLSTRGDALLPIDNKDPYGMYTLNRKPAGTAVTIGGEAGDKGPVNGIARVVLWFQRQGTGVSWHEVGKGSGTNQAPEASLPAGNFTVYSTPNTGPAWWNAVTQGAAAGDVIPAMNGGYTVQKPAIPALNAANAADGAGASAIVIDVNSPSVGQERWGHKLPMGFADGGIGKLWYVEINSYGIQSGPVDLHYVIIDKAGNAKYYKERLVIMNNVAVIDRIKLATDIRQAGSITGNSSTLAGAKIADNVTALTAAQWPELTKIRNMVPLGGTTDIKDDVKKGISDWVYYNAMGANKIIDFNVRNNLFGLRLETTKDPVGKNRTFRLEYISGATLYSDTGATGRKLTDMTAGKVYMINNPGTARWGAIGADGDGPWPRGYAFIAAVNGRENNQDKIIGTGSVWELSTTQVLSATSTSPTNASSAEFLYGTNAFSANSGPIVDYTRPSDAVPDAVFPPEANALYNDWTTWTNANQSLFMLRVFDGAETDYFGDFTIIRVRVNNDDRTKPFAQLYDINPKTEGQERQNIAANNNEQRRSVSPMFIGEGTNSNRTKGGLWNSSPTLGVVEKPGHIEPRSINYPVTNPATPYNTQQHSLSSAQMGGAASSGEASITKPFANPAGFFTADTVSGKVVLRGYAEDDQRIQRVALKFGTGAEIPILQFQANSNTPGNAGYGTAGNSDSSSANYSPPLTGLLSIPTAQNGNVFFTDSIDAYRHRVEWAYIWDTETVPSGTVVGGVEVLVTAYNRRSTSTNTDTTANTGGAKTPSDTLNANTTTGNNARRVHSDNSEANRPNTSPYNPGFPVGLYEYNQITMNLRPYITGFLRNKTQSHDIRSRQGRYMFYRGETAVVKGFNLGTGTISLPGAANLATFDVGTPGNFGIATANNNSQHYRQFTVTTAATTDNGVVRYSYNNNAVNTGTGAANSTDGANRKITASPIRPTYIQPWNIEYSPGVDGSTLWDDFTQAHIWQSNDNLPGTSQADAGTSSGRFASTNNSNILSPSMSVDPGNGELYESHNEGGSGGNNQAGTNSPSGTQHNNGNPSGNFNTGTTRKSTIKDANIPLSYTQFAEPILFSDVYRSPGGSGQTADTWVVSSVIGRSGSDLNCGWNNLGGIYISGPGGGQVPLNGGGQASSASSSDRNNPLYLVEGTYYNASSNSPGAIATPPSTDQFMNPHIVTSYSVIGGSTQEHIHVSYYDDKDGSIKYRYNRRGFPGTMTNQAPFAWTNLDGGVDADDINAFNADNANGGYYRDPWTNILSSGLGTGDRVVRYNARGSTINAGKHNAIAITSQGYPVIAYYDQTNQRLKLAVSRSVAPIAASNWVIRDYVIPDGNPNSFGTGEFVSMKINPSNNIVHIAAMNTAKRLVYITGQINIPTTGNVQQTTGGVLTDVTVQVVDSVGNVGRWCSLSLDSAGNPWISYMDESWLGARDGAKVAFLNKTTFYKGVNTGTVATPAGYFPNGYTDINGASLEGWETMHVPTFHRVENPIEGPGREHGRLGMACYPTPISPNNAGAKFWSAAVSYLSKDAEGSGAAMERYRIAYYVK